MKRSEVMVAVMSARTNEEIFEAFRIRNRWFALHPNDWGMYESCEMLELLADARGIKDPELEARKAEYYAQHPGAPSLETPITSADVAEFYAQHPEARPMGLPIPDVDVPDEKEE